VGLSEEIHPADGVRLKKNLPSGGLTGCEMMKELMRTGGGEGGEELSL